MNAIYGMHSNAFETNGQLHRNLVEWFSPKLIKNILNAIISTFPFLATIYKPPFFPPPLTKWLYNVMHDATMYRHQQQQLNDISSKRNDFLQFLLDSKLIENHSDNELAELAAIIFFDAFETTSMILAQALYHIANDEVCQRKLRTEIQQKFTIEQCPTASNIADAHYLDNIVNG